MMMLLYVALLIGAVLLGVKLWIFLQREDATYRREEPTRQRERDIASLTQARVHALRLYREHKYQEEPHVGYLFDFAFMGHVEQFAQEITAESGVTVRAALNLADIMERHRENGAREAALHLSPEEETRLYIALQQEASRLDAMRGVGPRSPRLLPALLDPTFHGETRHVEHRLVSGRSTSAGASLA